MSEEQKSRLDQLLTEYGNVCYRAGAQKDREDFASRALFKERARESVRIRQEIKQLIA